MWNSIKMHPKSPLLYTAVCVKCYLYIDSSQKDCLTSLLSTVYSNGGVVIIGYLEIVKAARANENIVDSNASGYLLLSISTLILTVFLELRSRKSVRFSEEIMSADNIS